jgi:endoglucanase
MRLEKMPKKNSTINYTITNFKNLLLLLVAGFLSAQQTPQELVTKMGRGLNLGNVLSAPVEGNWAGAATEQYFIDVANAGFTNVRIPIDFFGSRTTGSTLSFNPSANTSTTVDRAQFQVRASYLDRLEEVITWGLNQGLVIVLDFHGATLKSEFIYTFDSSEGSYTHPTSAKRAADLAKFYSIWEQIADRFKNYSDDLVFEVINEPYFHISAAEMNEINSEVISIIRASGGNNEKRKIIITGGTKNSYEAITTIGSQIINDDNYLIATYHYYLPFQFTKSSDSRFNTNSWGSNADKNTVDNEFDIVLNWANGFTPPVAVYLGEFGADNAYGYNYSTGDLLSVPSNPSGYASEGPDPNSREDYHGYVANAAIDRGFAFSAWDAGGKSSKTIHLRKDSGLTVYDFDAFSIDGFSPKQTSPSTISETDLWVENIKDALLNTFSERACNNTEILKNIDFECGFDTNWSFQNLNTSQATFEDASYARRQGSHGAKISVTQAANLNSVILLNSVISNVASFENKQLKFSVYGKGSVPGLQFKLRLKHATNGSDNIFASSTFTLDTNYSNIPYELTFDVPSGTSYIQLQLICGATAGTYYFDDFSVNQQVLGTKDFSKAITLYPNPVSNKLYIEEDVSVLTASLYNINGKKIKSWNGQKNQYDLSFLKNGIYFIEIVTENNLFCTKSIIKR